MPITTLPTPPTRQDPTNFADRADTFLAALPAFGNEANALATEVNGYASNAQVAATNAQAAATAAQASAGVTLWNASTTYTVGQTVYSPTSFYTYRRKIAGQTTTDPASDTTNWVQVTGTGNVNSSSTLVTFTGTSGVVVNGANSNRPVTINNGVQLKGESGSWSMAYAYFGSSGSNLGGFGALGTSDTLNYYWIGSSFSNAIAYFTPAGNVGIGTSSPSAKLHVNDTSNCWASVSAGASSTASLNLAGNAGALFSSSFDIQHSGTGTAILNNRVNAPMLFLTNNLERMRITEAGNVGIGVSAPSCRLDIRGSQGLGIRFLETTTGNSHRVDIGVDSGISYIDATSSTSGNTLALKTSGITKVTIDNAGNVGINTTTPTHRLDINDSTMRMRTQRTIASATAAGTQGEICWDSNYMYVCVATNTWKRSPLTTW